MTKKDYEALARTLGSALRTARQAGPQFETGVHLAARLIADQLPDRQPALRPWPVQRSNRKRGCSMNAHACPLCDCEEVLLLGQLGFLVWLRCRACGLDYSRPMAVEEE